MYRTFYGLGAAPFSPQPDIRFLYLNENRNRTLETVERAVHARTGFCVISGEPGVGKTILIQALIKRLGKHVHAGLVTCMPGSTPSFPELIASAFDIDISGMSTSEMYQRIKDYNAALSLTGKCALLILDNAHNLEPVTFKMLVHLASVDKALQVILVGHPELSHQFSRSALGESAPPAIIQTRLSEFNMAETDAYIRSRIVTAGGAENLFSHSASKTVYRFSRGVPGLINCACNYALEAGYEGKYPVIDASIISDLLKDCHDSDAKVTVSPEAPDEAAGIKPGPETGAGNEQDIVNYVRLASQHQRRQNRRLAYASLAGILLPVTAVVWLYFQLRPGEHIDPGGNAQITSNNQTTTGQLDKGAPQQLVMNSPPPASLPARSEKTNASDKLEEIHALNEIKATQRKLESHIAEQRVEQTRLKVAIQQEQERIDAARSQLLRGAHKPESASEMPSEVPLALDTPVYTAPAGNALLDENDKLAMIEELKERQHKLERRIAAQRFENNRIKEDIRKENERILKARAIINKAYKSALYLWDQFNNATPEPYPEDSTDR